MESWKITVMTYEKSIRDAMHNKTDGEKRHFLRNAVIRLLEALMEKEVTRGQFDQLVTILSDRNQAYKCFVLNCVKELSMFINIRIRIEFDQSCKQMDITCLGEQNLLYRLDELEHVQHVHIESIDATGAKLSVATEKRIQEILKKNK